MPNVLAKADDILETGCQKVPKVRVARTASVPPRLGAHLRLWRYGPLSKAYPPRQAFTPDRRPIGDSGQGHPGAIWKWTRVLGWWVHLPTLHVFISLWILDYCLGHFLRGVVQSVARYQVGRVSRLLYTWRKGEIAKAAAQPPDAAPSATVPIEGQMSEEEMDKGAEKDFQAVLRHGPDVEVSSQNDVDGQEADAVV